MAGLALRLVRRYFIGRSVTRETAKAAVDGGVTGATFSEDTLFLHWAPLGGRISDIVRVPISDLRRNGKDWYFID